MKNDLPLLHRLPSILALASLLVAVASAQTAGRFPCRGNGGPNQRICDLLSHPVASRVVGTPVDSRCVEASKGDYFCGWQGAPCKNDNQCDFGICTSENGSDGVCIGGLGDSCEGLDGADDALCMGNLGCQKGPDGVAGRAVCGGSGADCSFSGNYEPSSTKPNDAACVSGYCSPSTLTCSSRTIPEPGRPQTPYFRADNNPQTPPQRIERVPPPPRHERKPAPPSTVRQRLAIPGGASCPIGFTLCPVAVRGGKFDFSCVDTAASISHCGGCPSIGAGFWHSAGDEKDVGVDCSRIPGVASSACVDAKCRIFSCSPNFEFDRKMADCVPKKYW